MRRKEIYVPSDEVTRLRTPKLVESLRALSKFSFPKVTRLGQSIVFALGYAGKKSNISWNQFMKAGQAGNQDALFGLTSGMRGLTYNDIEFLLGDHSEYSRVSQEMRNLDHIKTKGNLVLRLSALNSEAIREERNQLWREAVISSEGSALYNVMLNAIGSCKQGRGDVSGSREWSDYVI